MKSNIYEYKSWMGNLPDLLKATPIVCLAIPGSHNTFTYSLTRWSSVSPDAPAFVRTLSHLFKPIANPIIYNWSKTQNLTVRQQLEIGIRYLDIRLACKRKEIFITHGLYGGKLQPFLREMNQFLSENPKEVLILDMQHFYEVSETDHAHLIAMLEAVFEDKILKRLPSLDIKYLNLNDFERVKAQVLIVYRSSVANASQLVWLSSCWPTYWPDTPNVADLIIKLDNALVRRISGKGFVSQFILTVDVPYVLKHIMGTLRQISDGIKQYLSPWVLSKVPGSHGVNVIISDFVDADFVANVISLNFKAAN